MHEENEKPEVTFLIEEYKNIAATHDKLRDLLSRLFNYFLLLGAFPFTVAGIMSGADTFDFFKAPVALHILFLFVGFGHLSLALALLDARLGQYRYVRTVNAIRKYFSDKTPNLSQYLYLPVDPNVPSWTELGHVSYQVMFMNLTGAAFVGYGIMGVGTWMAGEGLRTCAGAIAFVLYFLIWWRIRVQIVERYKKHKGIPGLTPQ